VSCPGPPPVRAGHRIHPWLACWTGGNGDCSAIDESAEGGRSGRAGTCWRRGRDGHRHLQPPDGKAGFLAVPRAGTWLRYRAADGKIAAACLRADNALNVRPDRIGCGDYQCDEAKSRHPGAPAGGALCGGLRSGGPVAADLDVLPQRARHRVRPQVLESGLGRQHRSVAARLGLSSTCCGASSHRRHPQEALKLGTGPPKGPRAGRKRRRCQCRWSPGAQGDPVPGPVAKVRH
jgi:hypothetical protein